MGALTINPNAIRDAVRHSQPVRAVADKVAAGTRRRARDHEYRESIEVVETEAGYRVLTRNSFAHLDEYGSVNNTPSGAMRSAGMDAGGTYIPNPEP